MPDQSPVLGLPYILPAQAQKHVTHNMAIQQLDTLVQLAVISATTSTPPPSPAIGDRYIVGASASLDWAGQENTIALWQETGWMFTPPVAGWQAHVLDQNANLVFNGSLWGPLPLDLQNLEGIGINTGSDITNKLSIAADATLLSHAGNGHQLKINKASTGATGSLLFQSNWSGRAEMGLTGDDDFHIKVSADGSSFTNALQVDATTGITQTRGLISGRITIADDSVGNIIPPSTGGFVLITIIDSAWPQIDHSGFFIYDIGASLMNLAIYAGPKMENYNLISLSGTTSTDGNSGFSVQPGQLQIENRSGSSRVYSYTFLGGL